ncbi:MAG TPA: bifunctional metallophosphatase/5'-nucleotidase, partial [Clostridia bacterium]|nr:bifunctional metallophosphatase/5'-nucleotidase [Clostridia bacterium]
MRKFLKTTVVMMAISFSGGIPSAVAADAPQPAREVTLLYIADLHAQLEEHPELFWNSGKEELVPAGGLARVAAAVNSIRKEKPGQVLFLDAGDTLQGSGPAAWSEGAALVQPLNALRLDLALPGNWEVVYGIPALQRRVAELNYPMLAANVLEADTGKPSFSRFSVREINGVRIGFFGYTDPDVPRRQPPGYSKG